MTCDYQAIRRDNEVRYGTDIGRIGPMLLADRYDDRTHFIFELLQNAEDALAKRGYWNGKRSVRFRLVENELRVSHFGKLFDEPDVRGVCGIAESTKDLTAIGRFGIGFKSVYAFTDRPEVYSGHENFAIESFVWPVAAPSAQREPEETLVVLPLRNASDRDEIETGLQRLGPGSLLFLRSIEEIEWSVEGGSSGLYLRSPPKQLGDTVRSIIVIGQSAGHPDIEESWLLFSKPVSTLQGREAGYVEIAFSVAKEEKPGHKRLYPVSRSPLVVFFPTVLETHLGILVQGPYRTTPSRDNVPAHDAWNRHCVDETATVLREALRWLRDNGLLDIGALRCLPLARSKFPEGAMFAPVFQAVRKALAEEPLLPRHGGGYVAASEARLARTQELRDLFSPTQLTVLLGAQGELTWVTGEISQDRTPELRDYLTEELKIEEVRPETILSKLNAPFLEAQPDEWICRLYEFLGDQKALLPRARDLPLIRLTDGSHVRAQTSGLPQAFLPGAVETGFPTVRRAVCDTEDARAFLEALGLTAPDLVDDVIQNILPRYLQDGGNVADQTYSSDIERILSAFKTDSETRRNRLVTALRAAPFVVAVEQHDSSRRMARPGDVYLATERLVELFAGVKNVLLVDNSLSCLKGEDARTLLVACGADRYLDPTRVVANLSWEQCSAIRRNAGLERASWENPIVDATLRGLRELLDLMPRLEIEAMRKRAILLWDALSDLESRHGSGAFAGTYTWGYSHESKTAKFDAAFVHLLNEKEWVPNSDGKLQRPGLILFESLGWKPNPFLLSKIRFKPPIIDELAREAGIEPGLLDLLKKLGLTSEADLRARLGVSGESQPDGATGGGVEDALDKLDIRQQPTPPIADPGASDPIPSGGHGGASVGGHSAEVGGGKRTPGSAGGGPFISYLATQADDEGSDPDSLDHTARMALEAKAIELILCREPSWRRTRIGNPGFDLFESGTDGQPSRWCEVKAMTGCLEDRPVGLSRAQFECARERGGNYWLYAVEHAGSENARIVRIQDPAGKARTFTFDRGWLAAADIDEHSEERED
jgi:hypothetical protein